MAVVPNAYPVMLEFHPMTNALIFDCSTTKLAVALQTKEQTFSFCEEAPSRHTELILPTINKLLQQANLKTKDLSLIGFGCGPGSFIGVRAATSVAQGLAYGLDLPVAAISTLQLIAQSAYQQAKQEKIVVSTDARKDERYWAAFELKAGIMCAKQEQLTAPELVEVPQDFSLSEAVIFEPKAMLDVLAYYKKNQLLQSALQVEPVYLRNNVTY